MKVLLSWCVANKEGLTSIQVRSEVSDWMTTGQCIVLTNGWNWHLVHPRPSISTSNYLWNISIIARVCWAVVETLGQVSSSVILSPFIYTVVVLYSRECWAASSHWSQQHHSQTGAARNISTQCPVIVGEGKRISPSWEWMPWSQPRGCDLTEDLCK